MSRIWTRDVDPTTIATVISKTNVLSLEFVDNSDRLVSVIIYY